MTNALAVATVTASIRHLLDQALGGEEPGHVGGAAVTTLRPEDLAALGPAMNHKGINVFLYQVTPNHAWNLTDLPTRDGDGRLTRPPLAAIDLHYLISCRGEDAALESQRLLARAIMALAVTPVLSRTVIEQAIASFPDPGLLAASDLARQVEPVKLTPTVLPPEEAARLWGVLGTPYLLSVTYVATVVLLQPQLRPRPVLRVRRRGIEVAPTERMRLTKVDTVPAGEPVVAGSRLVLTGSRLLGRGLPGRHIVRLGDHAVTVQPGATDERIEVNVDAQVPAGVRAIQVIRQVDPRDANDLSRVRARSDAVPVVVRPTVTVAVLDAATLSLDVAPPVQPGQDAVATLDRLDPGVPGPHVLEFELPVGKAAQSRFDLDRQGVPAGLWRVEVRVDGAHSLPTAVGEELLGPQAQLP